MKRVAVLFFSLMLTGSVFAKRHSITPSVILESIKAEKTLEKRGDELYLAVTEYPSTGMPSHYQIPKFPLYWPSEHLSKVKSLKVWSRELKEGEAATLLLSLIDKDAPPWNTDDLVGEVELHIKNDKGRLITNWGLPNRDDKTTQPAFTTPDSTFDLRHHGGHYIVNFSVR